MAETSRIQESIIQLTAKRIAFGLILLFALSLLAILVTAITKPSGGSLWFELFKEGFLFLSGALTTIIGYYFGSRGTQEAEKSAAIALAEANRLKAEAEKERKDIEELQEFIEDEAPTHDEKSLDNEMIIPDDEGRNHEL